MKYFLSFLALFVAISCSSVDNNFSKEANKFLDSIDTKSYNGLGREVGLTFQANRRLLAIFGSVPTATFDPKNGLFFINSRNNGASSFEGIYQENNAPERYIGIIQQDNGNTLFHTGYTTTIETINWDKTTNFAQKK
ncbi:MAG: hypothetical protein ACRCV0_05845 [Brevinema sp.]